MKYAGWVVAAIMACSAISMILLYRANERRWYLRWDKDTRELAAEAEKANQAALNASIKSVKAQGRIVALEQEVVSLKEELERTKSHQDVQYPFEGKWITLPGPADSDITRRSMIVSGDKLQLGHEIADGPVIDRDGEISEVSAVHHGLYNVSVHFKNEDKASVISIIIETDCIWLNGVRYVKDAR